MKNEQTINMCDKVMGCIKENNLMPRPKWYYYVGGVLWAIGLAGLFMHASLLLHRIFYFAVDEGPLLTGMSRNWKMLFIVISIPAAAWSFYIGTQMSRRYGVFYKMHPYVLISAMFAISIFAVLVIELTPIKDWVV